ncbi:MAG: ISAzo13 family transposase [Desulfovibrio sp.]|jgi:hypothetical protein|nr:ISAzo13 family transposase [Desulfovibrio sp.]
MEDAINYVEYFAALRPRLGEREFRLAASALAKNFSRGGVSFIANVSGLSRPTLYSGMRELEDIPAACVPGRQRKAGGGRKTLLACDTTLEKDLLRLVSPHGHGDPESLLLWTSKSLRKLSSELCAAGHEIGHVTVGKLLEKLGFTLQTNKKSREGTGGPDRDEQFEHISKTAETFIEMGQPVVSVDAKKQERVGNFKNNVREYHPIGNPEQVNIYDFINENGRAAPGGIYDIGAKEGCINVGISHDTAEFAVDSIRNWWRNMGILRYPCARSLLVTADGGGSNGSRNRLWKAALQKFADEAGLNVCVCHFPPGTSKWNKIEHRMFSMLSMNRRGRPLTSIEVIVSLIEWTKTQTGLRIKASKSDKECTCGIKVSEDEIRKLRILTAGFHPEWNYGIRPRKCQGN